MQIKLIKKKKVLLLAGFNNDEVHSNSKMAYTLFFIRTSNFGAEAERSYCFCQFEPEIFLRCS